MVITGESADLINEVQANDKQEVEINGHPIQAKRLDNVTSESSGQNRGKQVLETKYHFYAQSNKSFKLESNIASILQI